jgi:hypothetical protein
MDFEMNASTGKPEMTAYDTLEVTSQTAKDPEIQKLIDAEIAYINEKYLAPKGFSANKKLGVASDDLLVAYAGVGNAIDARLGRMLSESYLAKVRKVYAENGTEKEIPMIAVSAQGAIRDSLFKGDVGYEQAFNIVGIGEDYADETGYPLSVFYISGNDLFNVAEVDSSISGMLGQAKLFFAGLRYHTTFPRMFLNTVTAVEVQDAAGNWANVEKDRLYPIVANSYLAEMIGLVGDSSFNILNIGLFDHTGQPIKTPADTVINYKDGTSVKEWEALVDYIPTLPASTYDAFDQKIADNFTLSGLLTHWNAATYLLLGAVVLIALMITGAVVIIKRISRKRKAKRMRA